MDEMLSFRKNALLNNLCKEWDNMWKACKENKEKLVRLVLMQQSQPYFADYCYRGVGLSKEYVLENFADYINGVVHHDCDEVQGYEYALYVGYTDDITCVVDVLSMMWCDVPQLLIKRHKAPILYVSNNSKVHLVCEGYSYVRVYLFDESELIVGDTDENTDIIVYKYSENCTVTKGQYCLGRVNEFVKSLRL